MNPNPKRNGKADSTSKRDFSLVSLADRSMTVESSTFSLRFAARKLKLELSTPRCDDGGLGTGSGLELELEDPHARSDAPALLLINSDGGNSLALFGKRSSSNA